MSKYLTIIEITKIIDNMPFLAQGVKVNFQHMTNVEAALPGDLEAPAGVPRSRRPLAGSRGRASCWGSETYGFHL